MEAKGRGHTGVTQQMIRVKISSRSRGKTCQQARSGALGDAENTPAGQEDIL